MGTPANILPIEKTPETLKKAGRPKKTILDELPQKNKGKKFKIRAKELKDGSYSIFLDLWNGEEHLYEFLDIFIRGTYRSKPKDKEKIRLAEAIRDDKESYLFKHGDYKAVLNTTGNRNFFIEAERLLKEKEFRKTHKAKTIDNYYTILYVLKKFTDNNELLKIKHIDKQFCFKFRDYLLENYLVNSARQYFLSFKSLFNFFIERDITNNNPAKAVTIKYQKTEVVYLTEDELKKLKNTPCPDTEVKAAFLFSATGTGQRFSDLKALKFNQIENGYLNFRQIKTDGFERLKLSKNALQIIEQQKATANGRELVFHNLRSWPGNKILRLWAKAAGIDKHIHWHVSRHTFAVLALSNGISIYMLSKILGHKTIKNTEIYSDIVDQAKDAAIDRLPEI